MNKIKNIFALLILTVVVLLSCDDDRGFTNPFADINYEDLAMSDNDSIVKFLKNNYYDYSVDSVKTLIAGQTSLFDDQDKLKTIKVISNDIEHTLYAYVASQGDSGADPDKGFPTIVDSVLVKYSGFALRNTEISSTDFDKNESGIWFTLAGVIEGWTNSFPEFKGGELKKGPNGGTFNGPITYLNGGKGVLFIPSGLGYPSSNPNNFNSPLVNTNLIFYVELLDIVPDTDHDNDGTPSIQEDADGDGDPTNDFSDPNNPGLPDYLNPNIK
ncbi:peptidylprolyl isomerase [Polaribacter aestuariivivens]|uniref:peptidylprolyl isomerase n=1 Tax=Polaribacter aestuariivivens TaxID=2304626 RepID=A0A5S3NDR0_9FLAO|nr:peptidylprolyl isomerase [Polaribacter aestuariivivens]TMM31286.1 peptidylprolyl isomerase [Polaribacter aestuariivivens]